MVKQTDNRNTNRSQSSRERKVSVKEEGLLLPFLFQLLNGQSKSSVKAMLAHGQISVNGKLTTQFNDPLHVGDEVSINYGRGVEEFNNPLLTIVWEDDYLIVINKKEGLLSVSNSRVQERTAFHILSDYVKKKDPRNKIFILHRLDRDTSGIMMFAKDVDVQHRLRSTWNDSITQRTYVAVVEGKPEKETDLLVSNLMENKQMQVYVTSNGDGKEAITRYHVINSNGRYSLLELDLETGRKNQIRVQMQSIGHPIAGDYKYGAETNPTGRLMLHARRLFFIHPITGEEMRFETRIPDMFSSLVK
jgi:23S rRNA pseudouridine1911/1915/1917 synthase